MSLGYGGGRGEGLFKGPPRLVTSTYGYEPWLRRRRRGFVQGPTSPCYLHLWIWALVTEDEERVCSRPHLALLPPPMDMSLGYGGGRGEGLFKAPPRLVTSTYGYEPWLWRRTRRGFVQGPTSPCYLHLWIWALVTEEAEERVCSRAHLALLPAPMDMSPACVL